MSHNPLIPAKPAEITLDTLPQLFAHWRACAGGMTMTSTPPEQDPPGDQPPAAPQRPDGISEDEWNALNDPGRAAIVREREARQAAERALAASRARPAPPKQDPPTPPANQPPAPKPDDKPGDQPDIAKLVTEAVTAAVKPILDREEQREIQNAAGKVQDAVLAAAKDVLHDATDALVGIDLTKVVDDQGTADAAKIKTELEDLVKRKPHLAKPAQQRLAPPGIGGGAPAGATDAEKVKAVLADMQKATGVRMPAAPGTSTN